MMSATAVASVIVLACKRLSPPRNTLAAFLDLQLRSGLILRDCGLHRHANGRIWISLPGKPVIGADGQVQLDERGKRRFVAIAEWPDRATSDRFSAAVLEAVKQSHPEALP